MATARPSTGLFMSSIFQQIVHMTPVPDAKFQDCREYVKLDYLAFVS